MISQREFLVTWVRTKPAGWMTVQVFCEHVGNVFIPHLGKYSVKFSVAL
jgi:hypothetical protein